MNELFPIYEGILPAVPRTASQHFDRLCMERRLLLKKISDLQALANRLEATCGSSNETVASLCDVLDAADRVLASLDATRMAVYRTMVAQNNPL